MDGLPNLSLNDEVIFMTGFKSNFSLNVDADVVTVVELIDGGANKSMFADLVAAGAASFDFWGVSCTCSTKPTPMAVIFSIGLPVSHDGLTLRSFACALVVVVKRFARSEFALL